MFQEFHCQNLLKHKPTKYTGQLSETITLGRYKLGQPKCLTGNTELGYIVWASDTWWHTSISSTYSSQSPNSATLGLKPVLVNPAARALDTVICQHQWALVQSVVFPACGFLVFKTTLHRNACLSCVLTHVPQIFTRHKQHLLYLIILTRSP